MPFIARRFGFLLLAVWASITLNFAIPRLLPGNPAEAVYASHINQFGNNPHEVQTIQLALGLSQKPLVTQYVEYLGALLHGDLGLSFNYFPVKVSTIIGQTLPWTLFMVGIASIIAFAIGTSAGVVAAYKRGGALDTFVLPLTQLTSNFPFFFLALVLLYVFGLTLGWFPVSHAYTDGTNLSWSLHSGVDILRHATLPALALVIVSLGGWMLGMRNVMINTLAEDYVVMARARGLRERRVMFGYAARNALLPQITGFALTLGYLVGGQILIEFIFNYPGVGFTLAYAVGTEDFPLIQALLLIITLFVLVANFLVDLAYARLDPRVRSRTV
jgi:peptide/nickel transport system permease protein